MTQPQRPSDETSFTPKGKELEAEQHTISQRELNSSQPGRQGEHHQQRRKCCGLPPKAFVLVIIGIGIIVLAAILIPIIVTSLNRSMSNKAGCEKTDPCRHDGVSVSSGKECSCVCSGGFIGSQCSIRGDASCTTTTLSSGGPAYNNITVGNSLPGIFESSTTQFGIALDQITIMALFSQINATCSMQNGLVSMDNDGVHQNLDRRRNTKNNDILTTLMTRTAGGIKTQAVAFSRVAVLFVFEKTGFFAAAQDAEQRIYSYISSSGTGVLNLPRYDIDGNGFILDFRKFTITTPDGSVTGGR